LDLLNRVYTKARFGFRFQDDSFRLLQPLLGLGGNGRHVVLEQYLPAGSIASPIGASGSLRSTDIAPPSAEAGGDALLDASTAMIRSYLYFQTFSGGE